MGQLPLLQFVPRDGIIDLAWGHPDPKLLPVEGLRRAADRVFQRYGVDALAYGYAAGPGPLVDFVVERLAEVDVRAPTPDSVLVTGGNSHALDQVATLLTAPGDRVLIESPTYHLAVRILQDHRLELVPVPSDAEGLRVDVLANTQAALRRSGRPARVLYCIPTFNNPTGVSLVGARRQALVDLAAEERLVLVEDDTYRELSYDGPPPPSLWSLAPPGVVVRLGTFSKSLAPGLRCGYLTADAATVERFRASGLLDSGGGVSHFTSLVVAEYAKGGEYGPNVERLRRAYRERRDALLAALAAGLGEAATWQRPAGGYFVWVSLHRGLDADMLLPSAESSGISFLPGSTFYVGPIPPDDRGFARLAFALYPPEALVAAASRLAQAVTAAT